MRGTPSGLRARLFGSASRLLHWSGLVTLAGPLVDRTRLVAGGPGRSRVPRLVRRTGRNAQILVYHRVNDERDPYFGGISPALFERQMAYLSSRFAVLPLPELVRALRDGALPANALAVTLDDGYRDNYLEAFPILRRHSVPATIFLTTSAIGSDRPLWHDDVFSAFRETTAPALEAFGPRSIGGPLATVPDRLRVQQRVLGYLRAVPDEERAEGVVLLREALRVGPSRAVPGLMLSWDEAREMSRGGIQFGSHTVTHPILSRVDGDRARRELQESKSVIEDHLGVPVEGFAYPNGTPADFLPETKTLLRECGYRFAVTTSPGANDETADEFELRRGTPWDEDLFAFGVRLLYNKWQS
jgi:peptidoglycan/xylan/chitin deacetylase (PgdA/CDA1 family)